MKLNRRKFIAAMFGGAAAAVIPFKLKPVTRLIPIGSLIEIKEYGNGVAYTPTDDRILQIQKNMAKTMDRAAAKAFRNARYYNL